MEKNIVDLVETYVTELLVTLPPHYTYHNLNHTKEVVKAVSIISNNESFSLKEQEILKIAAWFHDTGFINAYKGHEDESVKIAKRFLKENDYQNEQILQVIDCILATKINHKPKNNLEKAIRDADVCHLGCDDYFSKLSLLKEEWEYVFQEKINDKKWYADNLNFLKNHQFQTHFCRHNFKQQKQKNLYKNFQKLAGLKGHI